MAKQQKKSVVPDVVPNPVITNVSEEQTEKFVVTRGGHRVSEREYSSSEDTSAQLERQFWTKVVNRHPDGTKVEIVPFNKKLHRIW